MTKNELRILLGLARQAGGLLNQLDAMLEQHGEADSTAGKRTRAAGAFNQHVIRGLEVAIDDARVAPFLARDQITLPRARPKLRRCV